MEKFGINNEDLTILEKELVANGYKYHHFALHRGYIRKNNGCVRKYNGKFGEGYIIIYPNTVYKCSNIYHRVAYYIKIK